MSVYLGRFENLEDILNEFYICDDTKEEIRNLEIILAHYDGDSYDGSAFVLFRKNGKLYEVNDSHCSCYGLENWDPEETTKEALLKRTWLMEIPEVKAVIEGL